MFTIFRFDIPFTDKGLVITTREEIDSIKHEMLNKVIEWENIINKSQNLNNERELTAFIKRYNNSVVDYIVDTLLSNHHSTLKLSIVDREQW